MKIRTALTIAMLLILFAGFAQDTPLQKAEKLSEQAKTKEGKGAWADAASLYNQAGYIYIDAGAPDKARDAFMSSISLNEKLGNYNAVAHLYNTIGRLYAERENFKPAEQYLMRGLKLTRQHGKKIDVASVLINLGNILAEQGNHQVAINKTQEALRLALEENHLGMIRDAYKNLAEYFKATNQPEKAAENFENYTAFDQKLQAQKEAEAQKRMQAMQKQAERIKRQKEYQQNQLQEKQNELKQAADSLKEFEALSKQQKQRIELLNQEKRIQDLELQQQKAQRREERIIRYVLIIGLLFVLAFGIVVFRISRGRKKANEKLREQFAEIQRQNEKIREQRKDLEESSKELQNVNGQLRDQNVKITNSINYARTIQRAMLPSEERLHHFIAESFVLFHPRDIVSGDFYWFTIPNGKGDRSLAAAHSLNNHTESNEFLMAAVDCTGHGVPGAFMSMIGNSLLNEIVNNGYKEPAQILTELDRRVKLVLHQEDTDSKDGMDMAMLHINRKTNEVTFAGANNPLIYLQNGEIKQIKGTSRAIGGKTHGLSRRKVKQPDPFSQTTISIKEPTELYIFSDGYIDQFGGPKNRKFMLRRFKDMIIEIHNKPMEDQKQHMEKVLQDWQGNHQQIDDILTMGLRLQPVNDRKQAPNASKIPDANKQSSSKKL